MCGIAGIFHSDGSDMPEQHLAPMISAMSHRGPDGQGCYINGSVGIGMTRLAIIDVEHGQQPILSEDGDLVIVCNGEIYNHLSLRAQLEKRGHRFRTKSDIEVILHLFEDQGASCFNELNGMFAAAIANLRDNTITLARDRFGQKPLYVSQMNDRVAFASELRALAAWPDFSAKISPGAIANYLSFRYVPAPGTIFANAEKLPPGTTLTIDRDGNRRQRRYWQVDYSPERARNPLGSDGLLDKLGESVERHLMSERPLGVFLSGGVDSAAIVASMHGSGHRDIRTYTVGFEGFAENEFEKAAFVADKFQTRHTEVLLTPDTFWDSLDPVVRCADEPLADLTTVPLYHLAQRAREDVVVTLSGEGADELLAGYSGLEGVRSIFEKRRKIRPIAPIMGMLSHLPWPNGMAHKLRGTSYGDSEYLTHHPYPFTAVFEGSCWPSDALDGISYRDTLEPLISYYRPRTAWHGVDLYLGGMTEWWLPDDLLHKADRMTMAHSLELRAPFLDVEFADYCIQLDLDDKIRASGGERNRKVALKRALTGILPSEFLFAKKKGFSIAAYDWTTGVYGDRIKDEVNRPEGLGSSLFTREQKQRIVTRSLEGDTLSQRRAWSIVVLNKWGGQWL